MDYNKSHLAHNAQNALQNHLREQEDRKRALLREQQMKELHQLEIQLFHKQEELIRVKTQMDRLKRELVVRESKLNNAIQATKQKNDIKNFEKQIELVGTSLKNKLAEITKKIEEKKRELESLEKEKQTFMSQTDQQKKTITSNLSNAKRIAEGTQKNQEGEKRLFDSTQKHIIGLEQSVKTFTQEILVLSNKIKALKSAMR